MTLQDRIIELLEAHRPHMVMWWQGCTCMDGQDNPGWSPQRHSEHVADLFAAAAEEHYRPRIETVEQLDALPVGTVLIHEDDPADLHVIGDFGPVNLAIGDGSPLRYAPVGLPATAVWSPGAGE